MKDLIKTPLILAAVIIVARLGLEGVGGWDVAIVGESFYQDNLRKLAGGTRRPDQYINFYAFLSPEPDNPYSSSGNAVALLTEDGLKLDHLSTEDGARYKKVSRILVARNQVGEVRATLIGGTKEKPCFGVLIDLLPPDEALPRLEEAE